MSKSTNEDSFELTLSRKELEDLKNILEFYYTSSYEGEGLTDVEKYAKGLQLEIIEGLK